MSADPLYIVTVRFDDGARATIRTHTEPKLPDPARGTSGIVWVQDDSGHTIEIQGDQVLDIMVDRSATDAGYGASAD
jgi:hypothetical protein